MKKIFYVLLCLTLVFSMVPSEMIGAYSSQSDNQTSAIEILDALEILPDDFICPLCKHGAADFEELK